MSEVKPIKPSDIVNLEDNFPPVIITAVNTLLTKNFRGNSVTLKSDDIIAEIQRLDSSYTRTKLYDEKLLDFEAMYRKYGWEVKYNTPDRDESFDSYFVFKPKI